MFRLALRQTEGLIGSIIGLLRLELRVPDHSTLSRRAKTLAVPRPQPRRGVLAAVKIRVNLATSSSRKTNESAVLPLSVVGDWCALGWWKAAADIDVRACLAGGRVAAGKSQH